MSKRIYVNVEVIIPDDTDPDTAANSIFDTLCEKANEDLIESVNGYDFTVDPE